MAAIYRAISGHIKSLWRPGMAQFCRTQVARTWVKGHYGTFDHRCKHHCRTGVVWWSKQDTFGNSEVTLFIVRPAKASTTSHLLFSHPLLSSKQLYQLAQFPCSPEADQSFEYSRILIIPFQSLSYIPENNQLSPANLLTTIASIVQSVFLQADPCGVK